MHPQVIRKNKYIELIETFKQKGLYRNQIQKQLQWTSRTLTNFLYNHNLYLDRYSNLEISSIQEQVIIGSLLGDGNVSYSGKFSKNARLAIKHGIKQIDYLKYKYNILKSLCNSGIAIYKRTDKRRYIPEYNECSFKTKSLKIFSDYRNNWYNPYKIVYKPDVNKLTPLGLSIWFMDDGFYSDKIKTMCLYTQSFTLEDNKYLQNILLDKFNIHTTIRKSNYLYIKRKSQNDFINLIKPYVINSMSYKIGSIKPGEFRETPEVDNPEPSSLNGIKVSEKVQRLTSEEPTNKLDTSARHKYGLILKKDNINKPPFMMI